MVYPCLQTHQLVYVNYGQHLVCQRRRRHWRCDFYTLKTQVMGKDSLYVNFQAALSSRVKPMTMNARTQKTEGNWSFNSVEPRPCRAGSRGRGQPSSTTFSRSCEPPDQARVLFVSGPTWRFLDSYEKPPTKSWRIVRSYRPGSRRSWGTWKASFRKQLARKPLFQVNKIELKREKSIPRASTDI